ncbi:MAG: RNase adapter RapZ [Oscillospiraceae bacterium]|nr:RNase adapter RapZ [Oscillospiraceae bacterium]
MQFLIITGLSGAGKTRAADVLEDMDYYCVDNMPAPLMPKLAEFCMGLGGRYEKLALVTDIRDAGGVDAIFDALDRLEALGLDYKILFVEADLRTLIRRYKETRRPHPLQAEAGSLEAAVGMESERLRRLRARADYIIDTSGITLGQLQKQIFRLLAEPGTDRTLQIHVLSFGYKHGIPMESDLVFDVRFLPNPYYVPELRDKTGMDDAVSDYVFSRDEAREFLDRVVGLLDFLIPRYVEEGKYSLTVAVGCTGGRHRSVAVARALVFYLTQAGHRAELVNRDAEK